MFPIHNQSIGIGVTEYKERTAKTHHDLIENWIIGLGLNQNKGSFG